MNVAVLTNGTRTQQVAKVERTGLAPLVGRVVTSEELGVAKPDLAAFTAASGVLGRRAHELLYVGDDYTVDVLPARAAGWSALHLDRDGTCPGDEEIRLTTLGELSAFLSTRSETAPDERAR